ncbi:unnamed protein product [Ambrosiozyma monospora]|uniref:Unnamed protein product n=1 Tax=Ambrosiozyma monospora TaxID=43982 RepID=A0A9W6Z128_AMBMO|nr:unnamed protein product [Ambrosiozyma monospora]
MSLNLSKSIKELRFFFPQTGSSSLKSFLLKSYTPLKAANPTTPLLIRECSGVEPTVVIRLEKGVEVKKNVASLSESEISTLLTSA